MMLDGVLHPGLVLIGGALLVPFVHGRMRAALALLCPLAALVLVFRITEGTTSGQLFGLDVVPLRVDRLARLFALVFALMAFGGALFSLPQTRRLELPAAFVYAGAAIGVTLAGDLLTVFVFWELMAVGSTLVLWSAQTRPSARASMRYLMIHLAGGILLLGGIALHALEHQSLAFTAMRLDSPAHWLIFAAFLINAGAPPLSAWLPDAYPESSWSGMVFLSAFTTKAAVYALLRGFPGAEPLIYIGLYMAMYGIVYALLENDIRRILAYSIVNQVGFMLTGIGIGTALSLNGAAAHAFAHIIYKALLLMSAGSVLYMTGKRKCTDVGGLYHSMPLTAACGIIGALSISAFPLTSGFVSKSMISDAAGDGGLFAVWMLLTAASAGVFLHAGIKFPWFVFFQKDSGLRPPDPPRAMRAAMVFFALICLGLGVYFAPLYALLPYPADFRPYTAPHVVSQLQLLLFSGLAFFALLPWLRRTLTISLDVDWIYRKLLPWLVRGVGTALSAVLWVWSEMRQASVAALYGAAARMCGEEGMLARTWRGGSTTVWMLVVLLALLVTGYLA